MARLLLMLAAPASDIHSDVSDYYREWLAGAPNTPPSMPPKSEWVDAGFKQHLQAFSPPLPPRPRPSPPSPHSPPSPKLPTDMPKAGLSSKDDGDDDFWPEGDGELRDGGRPHFYVQLDQVPQAIITTICFTCFCCWLCWCCSLCDAAEERCCPNSSKRMYRSIP